MSVVARADFEVDSLENQLTHHEAEALTKTINSAAENLGELLLAAHDGKAWAALGYESWRAYAVAEFQFSQSRAYRLMDHAKVIDAISPIGEKPSEAVTRPLSKLAPAQQQEAWDEAVATAPEGQVTAKHVRLVIENIDQSRVRPISPAPASSGQGVGEAEKDSETLWLLKSYWKKATKTERTLFLAWASPNQLAVGKSLRPVTERINYRPSNGQQYATMAICNLEKIQRNDLEREATFNRVFAWLEGKQSK